MGKARLSPVILLLLSHSQWQTVTYLHKKRLKQEANDSAYFT